MLLSTDHILCAIANVLDAMDCLPTPLTDWHCKLLEYNRTPCAAMEIHSAS